MGVFSFSSVNKTSIFSKNKSEEASVFTPTKKNVNDIACAGGEPLLDRKSTRLNSSH